MLKETLDEMLRFSVERFKRRTALIFFGNRITYGLLWRHVNLFSSNLYRLGVRSGDRVAIMLPNCPQSVVAYFAVLDLNATVVQFNTQYTKLEIERQFRDCEPAAFIVWDGFLDRLPEVAWEKVLISASVDEYLPFPINYLYRFKQWREKRKAPGKTASTEKPAIYRFRDLLRFFQIDSYSLTESRPDDIAVLQYTGGTTDAAKGAVLTHKNLVANVYQVYQWFSKFKYARRHNQVMLAAAPLFHSFAMTVCQNLMLFRGDTIVLVPDPRNLNMLMKLVKKYKPTIFPGPPRLLAAFADKARGQKISSIRYGISGSAPLPVKVLRSFEEATGAVLAEGYGLSETSPATHCNPLDARNRREGSIGLLMPDTEAKIIDEQGNMLPDGEVGELILFGPQVMREYWNKPEETEKAFRSYHGKKFFCTGDAAKKDSDGYFYIVDRFKDMIIKNGEKVYSLEVEEVLLQNHLVQDAAVVGKKNARDKEDIIAFIVPKGSWEAADGNEIIKEIKEFCQSRLTSYKVPDRLIFLTEIPKTTLAKTDKKKLREMA